MNAVTLEIETMQERLPGALVLGTPSFLNPDRIMATSKYYIIFSIENIGVVGTMSSSESPDFSKAIQMARDQGHLYKDETIKVTTSLSTLNNQGAYQFLCYISSRPTFSLHVNCAKGDTLGITIDDININILYCKGDIDSLALFASKFGKIGLLFVGPNNEERKEQVNFLGGNIKTIFINMNETHASSYNDIIRFFILSFEIQIWNISILGTNSDIPSFHPKDKLVFDISFWYDVTTINIYVPHSNISITADPPSKPISIKSLRFHNEKGEVNLGVSGNIIIANHSNVDYYKA